MDATLHCLTTPPSAPPASAPRLWASPMAARFRPAPPHDSRQRPHATTIRRARPGLLQAPENIIDVDNGIDFSVETV
ncbi:hypothetical protein [Streptomyces sp. DSM 41634]|uniref:hypothetical protein n=1 Tax=Streptomyces sp. DSM 41634 TaxID=3448656 RepID=UPI002888CE83|nr:hypothetical protein [Streptomyces sp. DSM 41633]